MRPSPHRDELSLSGGTIGYAALSASSKVDFVSLALAIGTE